MGYSKQQLFKEQTFFLRKKATIEEPASQGKKLCLKVVIAQILSTKTEK